MLSVSENVSPAGRFFHRMTNAATMAAKITPIPYPVMWVSGLFSPLIRELRTTRYQFTRPFVIDASATTDAFGLQPIALDVALRDAAARLRG